MDGILAREEECFVCGTKGWYPFVGVISTIGSPDLDGRPALFARSAFLNTIHRCPQCGYCAPNLSYGDERVKKIVGLEEYRQQLNSSTLPAEANQFLCWAMIQEQCENFENACDAYLHAAWVCDDDDLEEYATQFRLRACDNLLKVRKQRLFFEVEVGADEALLADLYRRCGKFEEAIQMCKEGLEKGPDDKIKKILTYQMKRAQKNDARRRKVKHALRKDFWF